MANVAPSKLARQPRISKELLVVVDAIVDLELQAEEDRRSGGEPTNPSPMFVFAQHARGLVGDLDDLEAEIKMGDLLQMRYVKAVGRAASDPWADTFPDHDDPQADFRERWSIIKFPAGMFARAVVLARSRPFSITSGSPKYGRFLVLCAALQELCGDEEIFIPVRTFGKELGVSPRTISTYITLAQRDGFLRQTAAAIGFSRAARFFFLPHFTDGTEGTEGTEGKEGIEGNHGCTKPDQVLQTPLKEALKERQTHSRPGGPDAA